MGIITRTIRSLVAETMNQDVPGLVHQAAGTGVGLMPNTLRTAIYSQPPLAMLPGVCIFITSLCFNLVSDGLRSAMDVRA